MFTFVRERLAGFLGVTAVVVLLPFLLNEYQLHVAVVSMYYVMLASAWNFLAGRAGIFSLGIHAVAGLAAYTSALAVTYFGLPFVVTMSMGVAVAVVVSFFLAALTLRMRTIYLALTTWAFAEISRLVIAAEYQITRGDLGLQTPTLFGIRFLLPYYYLFLAAAASTLIALYWISTTKAGFFIWAVGQDPILSSACGIDVYKWRIVATMISGAVAGVAGVLFGHYVGVLAPSILGFHEMATVIMMAIVGGYGTLIGPVLGAVVVESLMEGFRIYKEWRLVAFALSVIVLVRFYRDGIVGLLKRFEPLKNFVF
ncbi:MAG: branched-chain amino acid ABC transporter permease [Candidatus Caldarchaeales archaeon]